MMKRPSAVRVVVWSFTGEEFVSGIGKGWWDPYLLLLLEEFRIEIDIEWKIEVECCGLAMDTVSCFLYIPSKVCSCTCSNIMIMYITV